MTLRFMKTTRKLHLHRLQLMAGNILPVAEHAKCWKEIGYQNVWSSWNSKVWPAQNNGWNLRNIPMLESSAIKVLIPKWFWLMGSLTVDSNPFYSARYLNLEG